MILSGVWMELNQWIDGKPAAAKPPISTKREAGSLDKFGFLQHFFRELAEGCNFCE